MLKTISFGCFYEFHADLVYQGSKHTSFAVISEDFAQHSICLQRLLDSNGEPIKEYIKELEMTIPVTE